MITVSELSLGFNGSYLFKNVNLKFTAGNCYGVIGANGAGKSTFLKILSGEREPSSGDVSMPAKMRLSVLKQDHFAFDEFSVLDTIIMGNKTLYDIGRQKDDLYAKEEFTDADGMLAAELEGQYSEMGGWESESDASKLMQGLGLSDSILHNQMAAISDEEKVKVLLAQAIFGAPDVILLDEPTNQLDLDAIAWLEEFIIEYPGTVIVVSHDRHFLNNVCTHIVDIDFTQIKMYVGNYEFWYESSQLIQRLLKAQNKRAEEKAADLMSFIQRFSANKSKSKQATSRKKLLDKLTIDDMPASSRRYPFVGFSIDREPGRDILAVTDLTKSLDGSLVLNNVNFHLTRTDKVCIISENDLAVTTLLKIIAGELEPDSGTFKWGGTTTQSYFPKDNNSYFDECKLNIVEWLRQYSQTDETETYLRGFLGRMLFSGDDVFKSVDVLSGGEKVRCMLSKMMMFGSNVLVLDQPTNHLDLESITAVNNGLKDFKGVVVFTSHDHEFVQTVANRIIEITDTGVVDRPGTYDEYIEFKHNNKK